MDIRIVAADAANYIVDHKAKSAAVFFLGITAVAAAILLPMTFAGKFSPAMKNWMGHNFRIAGANMGDRWFYVAGAGGVSALLGSAALIIHLSQKPQRKINVSCRKNATASIRLGVSLQLWRWNYFLLE